MSNASTEETDEHLTLQQFQRAFYTPGFTRCDEPVLVHPGFPRPDGVTLWYAQAPGSKVPERVEAILDAEPLPSERLVHEPYRHVGRVRIDGLRAGHPYVVTLVVDGRPCAPVHASTAPEAKMRVSFSFLAYSCFAPFSGEHEHASQVRAIHGLNLLARRSRPPEGAPRAPSFALAMGDQVYVDDGVILHLSRRAFLDGWKSQHRRYGDAGTGYGAAEFFDALYEAYFRLQPYETSLRSIPHLMMWDDHDIRDGWGSQLDENANESGNDKVKRWAAHMDAARSSFLAYQFLRNPPAANPAFLSAENEDWAKLLEKMLAASALPTARPELYFAFQWGAAAHFFVLDLRSQRDASAEPARVISREQMKAVESWLAAGGPPSDERRPRLYVLVSSLPVTHAPPNIVGRVMDVAPFRRDDVRDCWWSECACKQRDALLDALYAHFRRHRSDRLLILSGDVHFAEILSLSLPDQDERNRVFGHEVISSGLAQSSFFSAGRDRGQKKARIHSIDSTSAGVRFFGPHFAEIFVSEAPATEAPAVEVAFYPATQNKSNHLVNTPSEVDALAAAPAQEGSGRLALEVGEVDPMTLSNFDRFMSPRTTK